MGHRSRHSNRPVHPAFRPILELIEERLMDAYPDFEMEKIKKAALLLFGPPPYRFVVPEHLRHLDDGPYEIPGPGMIEEQRRLKEEQQKNQGIQNRTKP